jgi:hypothetical protein
MPCSSSIPFEQCSLSCRNIFLIFHVWRTCRQLKFLFYDRSQIVFWKITKKMANRLYVNEILLQIRSHTNPIGGTRPGGQVQTGYLEWLSCATSPGTTGPVVTVLCRYVAWAVVSISVAWLGLDLLSQVDPWRDWESCHTLWHDSLNMHQSRQTDWRDWCNAQIANISPGLTDRSQNNQWNINTTNITSPHIHDFTNGQNRHTNPQIHVTHHSENQNNQWNINTTNITSPHIHIFTTSQMVNFDTQINKFVTPVIARNVHNVKSPESAKFVMTKVQDRGIRWS